LIFDCQRIENGEVMLSKIYCLQLSEIAFPGGFIEDENAHLIAGRIPWPSAIGEKGGDKW